MFIGREQELSRMNRLYAENRFQMFVLYGRRRVGKTTLLQEFCKDKNSIFYSAEQSNEKMNLEKISVQIFEHYHETNLEPFSTWEKVFLYIHQHQMNEPLALILDEFPYLANINSSLMSVLQHLIDHTLREGKLFLVLCGSYMGFMEKEVLGSKSPLFGRRTAQLHMKPFSYRTAVQFLGAYSEEEQLQLYGAYGGNAMYLSQISAQKTWEQNIQDCFLETTGYLYEEPMLLLRQEVQEPGIYCAIIEAIAGGASKSNEIATKTGENASKCLKYIHTLCELGILYREIPFGEKETSRRTIYCISDFMFRFWYRYVTVNKTLLETGAQKIVMEKRIKPDYSHYMGHVFEVICRDYLLYKNSAGELPLLFTKIGRWWGTDNKTHQQEEIDLIAQEERKYLFGECKWKNEVTDYAVLQRLREKADIFCEKREETWFVIFSKSGFSEAVLKEARKDTQVILVTLTDLFL